MKREKNPAIILNSLAYILSFVWLAPIIWMMVVAVKPESENTTNILNWFKAPYTLDNIMNVIKHPQADIPLWMMNSLIVAVATTVGVLILCSMTAFALSRIPFRGKSVCLVLILIGLMVPREATLIPLYLLCQKLEILNTYFSIVAPAVAAPFAVLILKNFFDNLPLSLFEAAKIDGCGWLQQMWIIAIPLSKPVISSLAILVFLQGWNEFLWPFISITEPGKITIPIGLPLFRSQYLTGQGLTMAAGALLSLPIIIAFIFLQKYIVKSIASTGIKG